LNLFRIWSLDIRILLKLVGDKPQPYNMVEQVFFVVAGLIPALARQQRAGRLLTAPLCLLPMLCIYALLALKITNTMAATSATIMATMTIIVPVSNPPGEGVAADGATADEATTVNCPCSPSSDTS